MLYPRALAAAAFFFMAAPLAAQAQIFNRPPAGIPGELAPGGGATDPAALMLRIDRLENQIRALTGQLEEAQFQNRRLEEQVRRLQGAAGSSDPVAPGAPAQAQQRREAFEPPVGQSPGAPQTLSGGILPGGAPPRGRGDAFDPTQMPGAPGAPRLLGQLEVAGVPGAPSGGGIIDEPYQDPNAPLDLLNPRRGARLPANPPSAFEPPLERSQEQSPEFLQGPDTQGAGLRGAGVDTGLQDAPPREPARTQVAMPVDPGPGTIAPRGPREELDLALVALRQNDLDAAESGLKNVVKRFPTGRLAPEAMFHLGEVYARRGRHREAAEQFLKVTTDHSASPRAPQSLHRLGLSLERLGAKEQACAAWAEVARKYPKGPASVRSAAERDMKRAQC